MALICLCSNRLWLSPLLSSSSSSYLHIFPTFFSFSTQPYRYITYIRTFSSKSEWKKVVMDGRISYEWDALRRRQHRHSALSPCQLTILPYMKVPPHIDSLKNSAPFKVKGFSLAFNLKPLYVTLVQSSHSNGQGQVQQAQANTDVVYYDAWSLIHISCEADCWVVLVWSLEYVTLILSTKKIENTT